VLIPPEPLKVSGPGALRFAAGRPNGLRSLTWRVEGRTNRRGQDEIYIGTRQTMKDVKLSLHQADGEGREAVSRLAFTAEFSKWTGGKRTVLCEVDEAPEFAPGWRQAAVILTASFTFGSFNEKPLAKGEIIQWFAEPPLPDHLKFYVVVGEPGHCDLTLGDHVGEVGHMRLTNDRFVGVVADSRSADAAFAEMVRNDLEKAVNTPGAYPFTWQTAATGFLFFLDLAVMLTDTLPTDG
jgi:hypothetical protein